MVFILHVDDIVSSGDLKGIEKVRDYLKNTFPTKDLRLLRYS